MIGTWEKACGVKGGGKQSWNTAADAGTWRGAQRRAAEAGWWRVRVVSMWTALCNGRGGGERVQDRGAVTKNSTDGRGGRIEGETKRSIKPVETGGAGELE